MLFSIDQKEFRWIHDTGSYQFAVWNIDILNGHFIKNRGDYPVYLIWTMHFFPFRKNWGNPSFRGIAPQSLREEAFHELEEFLTLCEELLINPGEAPGEPKATDSRPL